MILRHSPVERERSGTGGRCLQKIFSKNNFFLLTRMAGPKGLDFDDLQQKKAEKYNKWQAYGVSKWEDGKKSVKGLEPCHQMCDFFEFVFAVRYQTYNLLLNSTKDMVNKVLNVFQYIQE